MLAVCWRRFWRIDITPLLHLESTPLLSPCHPHCLQSHMQRGRSNYFHRDRGKCHQDSQKAFAFCHLRFFFFFHFHDSLYQLSLVSRLSPAISLQSISPERERQRDRGALSSRWGSCRPSTRISAPAYQTVAAGGCPPKGLQTSWGHLPISSLIMFLRRSVETTQTHCWAFVPTYIYIKTLWWTHVAAMKSPPLLAHVAQAFVSIHTWALGRIFILQVFMDTEFCALSAT